MGEDLRDRRGARLALIEWAELYNEQWLIERHGFRSPAQRRRDYYTEAQPLAA